MDSIALYLQKFSKLGFGDLVLKETIISIIKEKFDCELKKEDVKIKDGVVNIKTTPILKNEILIHKKGILENIQKKISDSKIDKIN